MASSKNMPRTSPALQFTAIVGIFYAVTELETPATELHIPPPTVDTEDNPS